MGNILSDLDRILRGEATRLPALREAKIDIPVRGICLAIIGLGVIYGVCMSTFSIVNRDAIVWGQIIASAVKVPILFYLTLIVTFPSLYVFNALVGSRLTLTSVFRLIIASLAVTLAVLASFGPIVAFFSFTTESYDFMVLLNVLIFSIAGILGLTFLLQTLHRLAVATIDPAELLPPGTQPAPPTRSPANEPPGVGAPAQPMSAIDRTPRHALSGHVKIVFRIWIIVFGLVGAQMAWVLRPFIGHPDLEFTWFRPRQSNFFESVVNHLIRLFS